MADPEFNSQARQWIADDTRLNFEQRVLNPSAYPVLKNEEGSHSTHSMAWGDAGGKFYAYPTVVQDGDRLVRLPDELAWQHARQTGEYREFTTPEDADAYATGGYKNSWGRSEKQTK